MKKYYNLILSWRRKRKDKIVISFRTGILHTFSLIVFLLTHKIIILDLWVRRWRKRWQRRIPNSFTILPPSPLGFCPENSRKRKNANWNFPKGTKRYGICLEGKESNSLSIVFFSFMLIDSCWISFFPSEKLPSWWFV